MKYTARLVVIGIVVVLESLVFLINAKFGWIEEIILIQVIISIAVVPVSFWLASRIKENNFALIEKKKEQYRNDKVFLCTGVEDIGDGLVQLYGEPLGTSVQPGMKITISNVEQYVIKEVYADDEAPDKPSKIIPAGKEYSAIVVEASGWDWANSQHTIKKDGVAVYKLS